MSQYPKYSMSKIEKNVMSVVAAIYAWRLATSFTALRIYLCVASVWAIGQLVWVTKIFENVSHVGLSNFPQFMLGAVLNTEFLVQVTVLAVLLTVASLLFDVFRSSSLHTGRSVFS